MADEDEEDFLEQLRTFPGDWEEGEEPIADGPIAGPPTVIDDSDEDQEDGGCYVVIEDEDEIANYMKDGLTREEALNVIYATWGLDYKTMKWD